MTLPVPLPMATVRCVALCNSSEPDTTKALMRTGSRWRPLDVLDTASPVLQAFQVDIVLAGIGLGQQAGTSPVRARSIQVDAGVWRRVMESSK